MKDKINVAKLLRDCPSGMELDCTIYDNLYFDSLNADYYGTINCYILIDGIKTSINFTKYGTFNNHTGAKCVIFPKGKTTWEQFHRPFKDGDIVFYDNCVSIFKEWGDETLFRNYVKVDIDGRHSMLCDRTYSCGKGIKRESRLATEEEKAKLFKTIKDNGYCWNGETKTLKKLVEPKFRVGDKVKHKCDKNNTIITITGSKNNYYYIQYYNNKNEYQNEKLSFTDQDKYELIIDKFDINTLKPFDKVLVRMDNKHVWSIQFFERLNTTLKDSFVCMGRQRYHQCIPYEGNEHLLNTTNDCEDHFKTWQNE